jgi:plasmid maintenance system killer protein
MALDVINVLRYHYSIRINDKWRVCFQWEDGDAHEV